MIYEGRPGRRVATLDEVMEGTGGVVEGAGVVLVGEGETVCTVPARCPHRMTSVCEACARA